MIDHSTHGPVASPIANLGTATASNPPKADFGELPIGFFRHCLGAFEARLIIKRQPLWTGSDDKILLSYAVDEREFVFILRRGYEQCMQFVWLNTEERHCQLGYTDLF